MSHYGSTNTDGSDTSIDTGERGEDGRDKLEPLGAFEEFRYKEKLIVYDEDDTDCWLASTLFWDTEVPDDE